MIRKAEEKDYLSIYQLGELLHENYQNKYNLNELLQNEYFNLAVYEEDKQIVGFISYTSILDTTDIVDIIVIEPYRQKKIASNLMDYVITNSKPNTIFLLEVAVDNLAAINLYNKFGFKVIHTRKKYYGKKDAYVMERVVENE